MIAAVANNHEGIVGVAPEARLLFSRRAGRLAPMPTRRVATLSPWPARWWPRFDAHAQMVNLSLGGSRGSAAEALIREGLHRGVLFVGAAAIGDGRRPRRGSCRRPVSSRSRARKIRPPRGSALYAPGREILTLLPGGHYDFASGDSIATAQVTGVVALLLEKNHALTTVAAVKLLRISARPPMPHAATPGT